MASRAMAFRQEPRALVTRVALSHLGRHVIGGCTLSDVRWKDDFHEVGVQRLGHRFKSYSWHRMPLDADAWLDPKLLRRHLITAAWFTNLLARVLFLPTSGCPPLSP